jgi:hypothetical protein
MSDIQPAGSLEIRWLIPGQLDAAVAGWFRRFPAETKTHEDAYLLDPPLPGLSVKVRSRQALEVKAYRGSPGTLEVGGRALGALQYWQKWSFPLDPHGADAGMPGGWIPVHKTRHVSRFWLTGGQAVPGDPQQAGQPVCSAELAQAHVHDEPWWTIGFEATGPAGQLRAILEGTAALMFAQPLPAPAELGSENASSYPHWLTRQASAPRR